MTDFSVPGGCHTAMVTPFDENGGIDWAGLKRNTDFQISQKVTGLLWVGTTGESPTLSPEEHRRVIARGTEYAEGKVFIMGGGGSNSLTETEEYVEAIEKAGCDAALLVDPYYNGPSSLEIRECYYQPIAKWHPRLIVIPYIIPGRTGCALEPADLAVLSWRYPNICAVKEARGDFEKMKEIRNFCQLDFGIFSGDDDRTWRMMTDPEIRAKGVISVISNIAPGPIRQMCEKISAGQIEEAQRIRDALDPLFGVVTVTAERTERILTIKEVTVKDKFRNPVPIKTIMRGLGMPAGPCRLPLKSMTPGGVEKVRDVLKKVWNENSWILQPIEDFYNVSISDRLVNDKVWTELSFREESVIRKA